MYDANVQSKDEYKTNENVRYVSACFSATRSAPKLSAIIPILVVYRYCICLTLAFNQYN